MKPSKVAESLRSIASKIDASSRPSMSAVLSTVRKIVASVEEVEVEVDGRTWKIANPGDHDWTRKLWALTFGAYGDERVLAWANGEDSALEEAAEFMKESGQIGHFVSDETMQEHYEDAKNELGPDAKEEQIAEKAETDLTYTESGYIPSHEWWIDEASGELLAAAKAASEKFTNSDESDQDQGSEQQ